MTLYLRKNVTKYLDRLNEPYKSQITTALVKLEKEPPEGDIKPMSGQPGRFRLRIGNYRALFHIKNNCIVISHIDLRGQIYKKRTGGENDRGNFTKRIGKAALHH